jgi:hypothetical protein
MAVAIRPASAPRENISPLLAHRVVCCGCTEVVGVGAKRTSPAIYEYAFQQPHP